jgi:hypothetical protein
MTEIQQLRAEIKDLQVKQVKSYGKTSAMSVTVAKMDKELFGNGRPGLVQQMGEVQTTQKMILKAMWMIGGALTTVGLGILGALLMG